MTRFKQIGAAGALIASFGMAVPPAAAANIGAPEVATAMPLDNGWSEAEDSSDYHRRYRHHRHRGIGAGDVLAGVLVLGGIAAIASAASNSRKERRYPVEQPRYRENERRSNSGQGIDRAVDMCLAEIERDVRVESVDGVDRTGEGWSVQGRIYNGEPFNCRIDNNGRVSDVSFGGRSAQVDRAVKDRQWSDERYKAAWRSADASAPSQGTSTTIYPDDKLPAYPGGPIDGDIEGEGEALGG